MSREALQLSKLGQTWFVVAYQVPLRQRAVRSNNLGSRSAGEEQQGRE